MLATNTWHLVTWHLVEMLVTWLDRCQALIIRSNPQALRFENARLSAVRGAARAGKVRDPFVF